jgi:membrane protein DedA with SNARE-associated domain
LTETLSLSPQAIAEWVPFTKAAGFFFATFILEDVAAIGAGLLLATGDLSWPAAFTACFLGIWFGDAGLYGLARFAGRSWFERSSLRRFALKVARSERWFAERGTPILIFSRAVPGARLPTYLAAGFLRVPLPRFLLITGATSFAWTFVVLILAESFGARLVHWLNAYKHAGLALLAASVVIFALLQLLRRAVMNFDSRRLTAGLARWRHWEFWPA